MLIRIVIGFLIVTLFFDSSIVFAAGPWKGKIIDIETKEPLEGAVVLAVWERVYRTPAGDNSYFYEAKEVLTDKEGRFEIPAYTPINLLPLISYMRGPTFTIFKPGYGSFPRYQVTPEFIPFDFFEREETGIIEARYPGERDVTWGERLQKDIDLWKKIPIKMGIVELPPLKTREERLRLLLIPPSIPEDKMSNLIELINEEASSLGLQPTHLKGGSK